MSKELNQLEWQLAQNYQDLILHFDNHKDNTDRGCSRQIRDGMKDTPARVIRFLRDFTKRPDFDFTVFDSEGMDEMVLETQIPFYSLCEHHLLPFFGVGHIAYIPNKKIAGLSKLARCLDYHAHGFQNQERITAQVAEFIASKLDTSHVAVTLKARHMCMEMRGAKKHDVWTVTSKMLGDFKTGTTRNEFLNLIK